MSEAAEEVVETDEELIALDLRSVAYAWRDLVARGFDEYDALRAALARALYLTDAERDEIARIVIHRMEVAP